MTSVDYEMWLAAHDECGPEGCGACVILGLELSEELVRRIRKAAHLLRIPADVFMYQAISAGLAVACS